MRPYTGRMRLTVVVLLALTVSAIAQAGGDSSFVGTWVGTRANNSIKRVVISSVAGKYQAQIWAFSTFDEIDWGKRPLEVYAKDVDSRAPIRALGEWPSDFARSTVVFRREGRSLVMETYCRFTGRSGRHNYFSTERLRRR